jgi:4-hydroxy-tetrahydrodipicolinate synthase
VIDVVSAKLLNGLWAAVPTPWDSRGKLDTGVLSRNIEKLASVPVDGVYTTDSDGEFYAIELDVFRQMVATYQKAIEPTSLRTSIGVTWCSTAGIIDRIKICLDHGISSMHIAFPFWMPLSPGDVDRFWEDLAEAAPRARWIHYNIDRGNRLLEGADYVRLAKRFPEQLIGTKMGTISVLSMADCILNTPQLSHLTVDYATVPAMMLGATGVCSYWANTLPQWTKRMMDLCRERQWEEAMAMQAKLLVWETTHVKQIRKPGHLHGIIGKARGALTGFLEDSGYTQPPYYPVDKQLLEQFKKDFKSYWGDAK